MIIIKKIKQLKERIDLDTELKSVIKVAAGLVLLCSSAALCSHYFPGPKNRDIGPGEVLESVWTYKNSNEVPGYDRRLQDVYAVDREGNPRFVYREETTLPFEMSREQVQKNKTNLWCGVGCYSIINFDDNPSCE